MYRCLIYYKNEKEPTEIENVNKYEIEGNKIIFNTMTGISIAMNYDIKIIKLIKIGE